MNAPLPIDLSKTSPDGAYEKVAVGSNEVAATLAKRLRQHAQGEVLFSAADRGRYATDASIYQVMPLGVFVPRDAADVCVAMDICRDLGVSIVPRGGGTSQCGQTVGAGLVIDHSKHMRKIMAVDAEQRTATDPRLGKSSTRPSAASILMASRSGVREMCSSSHSVRSLSFPPGGIKPSTNIWRKRCATCACKTGRGRVDWSMPIRNF